LEYGMAGLVERAAADLLSGLCEDDRAALAAVREEVLPWDPWVRDPKRRALFELFQSVPGLQEDCRALARTGVSCPSSGMPMTATGNSVDFGFG